MDIQELVNAVTLSDIKVIECSANMQLDPQIGTANAPQPGELETSIDFQLNQVSWGTTIENWFRIQVSNSVCDAACAVAIIYEREDDTMIAEELRTEFLERVAIMAAYPYLRAGIANALNSIGIQTPPLPIVRQGEFHIDPTASEQPHAND